MSSGDERWSREHSGEEEEPENAEPVAESEEEPAPRPLPILPVVAILGLSAAVFVHFFLATAPTSPQPIQTVAIETPKQSIKVYVVGAVTQQGVVNLPPDSRVEDAIKAAGGFSAKADPSAVNLAARLSDGDMVKVPGKGEIEEVSPTASLTPAEIETPEPPPNEPPGPPPEEPPGGSHFQGGPVEETPELTPAPPLFPSETGTPPPPPVASGTPAPVEASPTAEPVPAKSRVSLNRGTVEDFAGIPGISEDLATAIVAYRRGPPARAFTSLDELARVPGFQAGKVDAFIPYLKL